MTSPPADENPPAGDELTRKRAKTLLRVSIGVLFVALVLYRVDWTEATHAIANVSLGLVAGAFIAMAIGLIVSAWKWRWALRLHEVHFPFVYLMRTLCVGFFFNGFLPTAVGGDAYRVLRTMPRDGYRSRALSAVIVERGVGLLALLVLGGAGALRLAPQHSLARQYWFVLLILILTGASALAALERGWLHRLAHRWRRLPALDAVQHSLGLIKNRRKEWLGLIAGSFAFQLISVGAIFVLFSAVGTIASVSQCALIAAVVGISAAIPLSVNGLGVMEGALVATAVALKIDYEAAVVVAFARRALALCLAAPCGALWLFETRGSDGKSGPAEWLRAFRRNGLRSLIDSLQPPSAPSTKASLQPLVDSTEVPLDIEPLPTPPGQWNTQLLEFTHDAIIIWEMQGAGIVYWNRGAEQLYGYGRDEARGRTTHELLRTEIAGGVTALEKRLADFSVWVGELRHRTREGKEVVVEARLTLMAQENGRWLVLEVNRDITDHVAADSARKAMESQLSKFRTSAKDGNDD